MKKLILTLISRRIMWRKNDFIYLFKSWFYFWKWFPANISTVLFIEKQMIKKYSVKNKKTTWDSLKQRLSFDFSSKFVHHGITWSPFTFVNSTIKPQSLPERNDSLGWRSITITARSLVIPSHRRDTDLKRSAPSILSIIRHTWYLIDDEFKDTCTARITLSLFCLF